MSDQNEDIRIVGIVAEEVSSPRPGDRAGGGLYEVPIRLSRHPDPDWAQLFVPNWDRPSRYTSMHRPGIASIEGDKIVLNGTTLDEVEKYHRDTLKLAVAETNRQFSEHRAAAKAAFERQKSLEEAHRLEVERRAKEIKFD